MSNVPLNELHRPKTLANVVGQETIVRKLRSIVEAYKTGDASFNHMLFVGGPGTGKSTVAFAFVRDLFGPEWKDHILELNASDERGIDTIREKVKTFARRSTLGQKVNVVLLDEADALTSDAQGALRRIMEDYKHCRFILAGNYVNRIIDPIKSRCTVYRFQPIETDVIEKAIAGALGGYAGEDFAARVAVLSRGSLRNAWSLIQGVETYNVSNLPPSPIEKANEIWEAIQKGDVRMAEENVLRLLRGGVPSDELFESLFNVIAASGNDRAVMALGETEWRVCQGSNEELQLRVLCRTLKGLV